MYFCCLKVNSLRKSSSKVTGIKSNTIPDYINAFSFFTYSKLSFVQKASVEGAAKYQF